MASAIILDWLVGTVYVADETVIVQPAEGPQYADKIWRCVTGHTASSFTTDFGNSLWEELVIQGIKGSTGDKGVAGNVGATGAKGDTGANGIFTDIATQAEAEAGTDSTKGMTSLRTKQAIDYNLIADRADIVQNTADIASNDVDIAQNVSDIAQNTSDIAAITIDSARIATNKDDIAEVQARMSVVENGTDLSFALGQQRINNNQAAAVEILGGDFPSEGGVGNRLELNPVGAKSAQIRVEIFREDDVETRFTIVELELHFVSGTWYVGRFRTLVLLGEDDGVVFTVAQDGNDVATISYTSDDMAGGNYKVSSYLKYELKEISNF